MNFEVGSVVAIEGSLKKWVILQGDYSPMNQEVTFLVFNKTSGERKHVRRSAVFHYDESRMNQPKPVSDTFEEDGVE